MNLAMRITINTCLRLRFVTPDMFENSSYNLDEEKCYPFGSSADLICLRPGASDLRRFVKQQK